MEMFMTKFNLKLLALISLFFIVIGCDQGPAEKVGEKIDNTVDEIGNELEDAGDDIEDQLD